MVGRRMAGVLLCAALVGAVPLTAAAADCRAKVDELDRLIAQATELDAARRTAVKMMRDMGARQCDKGNEAAANPILDSQIQALSRHAGDDVDRGIPKARLTVAYLRGDWCTWQVTDKPGVRRDSGRYHFYDDGSFHVGGPPSYGLDTSAPAWPHERFLEEDYIRLIDMDADEFHTRVHGMRTYVWKRGHC